MIPLSALPGILLTSLVPGWLLVRALYPEERVRDPLAFAKVLVLSVAFSISITIVVASALGFAPHAETGLFRPLWIAVALASTSIGLFAWGITRGAYPRLSRTTAKARRRGVPTAGKR